MKSTVVDESLSSFKPMYCSREYQTSTIVCNDHKALARFLKGRNANNKVIRWGLDLATYNITFKWISGVCNKAADCFSRLVELPQDRPATVNMLSATSLDGPAFNTRSRTAQCISSEDTTSQSDAVTPDVTDTPSTTPKSLTMDRLQALLQMQKIDPFCKQISKWLSNGKSPKHEADLFQHVKGLLYKHVTDSNQSSWLLSNLKHGNTQCWLKHMINLVTRELFKHIV